MSLVPAGGQMTPMGAVTVRTDAGGTRWVTLPTSTAHNRTFFITLSINEEEREVARMPSRDIEIRLPAGEDVSFLLAKIIRREGYFRAVLVQSRGQAVNACPQKCGRGAGTLRFRACTRIATYQNGACAECVWQSHGARCQHYGRGSYDNDDDDDDEDSDENPRRTRSRTRRERKNKARAIMSGRELGGASAPMVIE
ncbi:hypothetical protein QIS74_00958 [Colletotrichum tabaci]|uniref:Uncharacterized protein n=1 Tax=Colletotrichum tabaci TaxID=1209068 RepID=A0AAV9T0D1_9PEZI